MGWIAKQRTCELCGEDFIARAPAQRFCCEAHRRRSYFDQMHEQSNQCKADDTVIFDNIRINVIKLMAKHNLSGTELCKRSGISQSCLNLIKNSKRRLGLLTAIRLCNYFNITLNDLVK